MENTHKVTRLELEHLQEIFNFQEGEVLPDAYRPSAIQARSTRELSFKDIKVLDMHMKGGQNFEFEFEGVTMVSIGFQLSGRGKTAYPGYLDYFEAPVMTYNLIYQKGQKSHSVIYGPEDHHLLLLSFTPQRFMELISSSAVLTGKYARIMAEQDFFMLNKNQCRITPPLMQSLEALRHMDVNNPLAEMLAEALIMSIIVHVHTQQEEPGETNRIREVKQYLEENYLESIPIKQLSRQFGINECDLKRSFKMEFNNTIFGFVQQLRMERAKQQLLAGKSIKEVAFEIGYEHPHHFSTAFRKWYHITPSRLQ